MPSLNQRMYLVGLKSSKVNMKYKCFCCEKIAASPKGLGQHISKMHRMDPEKYALLTLPLSYCACGNRGRFISICKGWDNWCSNCESKRRSESAKAAWAALRGDAEKYANFRAATSTAVKKQWEMIDQTDRIKNMGIAVKNAISKMTQEERNAKFGWMNDEKITPEKKRQVWEQSLKAWFDNLSDAEKDAFHSNRIAKIIQSEKPFKLRIYDNNLEETVECNKWLLNCKSEFSNLNFNEIFRID